MAFMMHWGDVQVYGNCELEDKGRDASDPPTRSPTDDPQSLLSIHDRTLPCSSNNCNNVMYMYVVGNNIGNQYVG